MGLEIDEREGDGAFIVTVSGEVDLYSSPELRRAVTQAVAKRTGTVAVDLRGVQYMDSSGVATLVEGLRAVADTGTGFVLVAPSQPVVKVLQLARLDAVFDIRDRL
ncbi:MAG: STAS domain-containing protein [Candidatus Hydrogenedentes bacterium]|nr:STAS domain-containing protein [Candidatus Hydrogenedentota bacterium]